MAAGGVWLFYGPFEGTLEASDVDVLWQGEAANDAAGAALLGADLDGDGLGDLVETWDATFTKE